MSCMLQRYVHLPENFGLGAFPKIYQERSAEYLDQTCNACYKHMHLQENIGWMPLPRYIKKEVLSTLITHVMHATDIIQP